MYLADGINLQSVHTNLGIENLELAVARVNYKHNSVNLKKNTGDFHNHCKSEQNSTTKDTTGSCASMVTPLNILSHG